MKKLFTLLLAIAVSIGIMNAVTINGLNYNLDATNLTAEVARNDGASGDIIIPATVIYNAQTYSVTSIGYMAFSDCSGLTSVMIGNSVMSIGGHAFYNCSGLTSVMIGNSVTSIGYMAFYKCGLTSVTIPNSVTSIGEYAFVYCSGLTSVTIGNSVTSIGDYAFKGCSALTSVMIPNSVTSIGEGAFAFCSGLTSVTIGNSVTSIGSSAFYDCESLTSVAIPNSVTSIGDYAFYGCSGLTSVAIPNSVTSIGEWAFSRCSGLTSIEIPNSVTSIGEWAFRYCTSLTSVTNNSITPQQINSNVFNNVDKSACTLYVPKESVDLYEAADVWKEFSNIVSIPEPIETIEGDYTIYYVDKDSQDLTDEVVTLHVPVAPVIEGFTFVRWQAFADNIEDGITIQAVYTANTPTSAPAVYNNPANPAQKLIKNGNVYILTDDKTYTVTGQLAK